MDVLALIRCSSPAGTYLNVGPVRAGRVRLCPLGSVGCLRRQESSVAEAAELADSDVPGGDG